VPAFASKQWSRSWSPRSQSGRSKKRSDHGWRSLVASVMPFQGRCGVDMMRCGGCDERRATRGPRRAGFLVKVSTARSRQSPWSPCQQADGTAGCAKTRRRPNPGRGMGHLAKQVQEPQRPKPLLRVSGQGPRLVKSRRSATQATSAGGPAVPPSPAGLRRP
jgi:hypothetical protein